MSFLFVLIIVASLYRINKDQEIAAMRRRMNKK